MEQGMLAARESERTEMAGPPALEVKSLTKAFPGFRLSPVDLTVPSGALFGLIGPNGAGKTTMLNLVMGLGRPNAGTISVFGFDHLREEVEARVRIGFCSQNLTWHLWRTLGRAISFVRPYYPNWDDDYCEDLMNRFGLHPDDRLTQLSFGGRTKVGILMALSHRPALLLMDEPTAGLDAAARRVLFDELLAAVQSDQRTVVISSHDLSGVERYSDHIGILHRGDLLACGETAALVESYRQVRLTPPKGWETPEEVRVLKHEGNEALVLAPLELLEELKRSSTEPVREAGVDLEELFLGLTAK